MENPLLEVVKHANLHRMEKVVLREFAHNAGNMSNNVESSVNMAQAEFRIRFLVVGMVERST